MKPGGPESPGRREALDDRKTDDPAAGGLDGRAPDDLVRAPIGAFDQHIRPQPLDEPERRLPCEGRYAIDISQRAQHLES